MDDWRWDTVLLTEPPDPWPSLPPEPTPPATPSRPIPWAAAWRPRVGAGAERVAGAAGALGDGPRRRPAGLGPVPVVDLLPQPGRPGWVAVGRGAPGQDPWAITWDIPDVRTGRAWLRRLGAVARVHPPTAWEDPDLRRVLDVWAREGAALEGPGAFGAAHAVPAGPVRVVAVPGPRGPWYAVALPWITPQGRGWTVSGADAAWTVPVEFGAPPGPGRLFADRAAAHAAAARLAATYGVPQAPGIRTCPRAWLRDWVVAPDPARPDQVVAQRRARPDALRLLEQAPLWNPLGTLGPGRPLLRLRSRPDAAFPDPPPDPAAVAAQRGTLVLPALGGRPAGWVAVSADAEPDGSPRWRWLGRTDAQGRPRLAVWRDAGAAIRQLEAEGWAPRPVAAWDASPAVAATLAALRARVAAPPRLDAPGPGAVRLPIAPDPGWV